VRVVSSWSIDTFDGLCDYFEDLADPVSEGRIKFKTVKRKFSITDIDHLDDDEKYLKSLKVTRANKSIINT